MLELNNGPRAVRSSTSQHWNLTNLASMIKCCHFDSTHKYKATSRNHKKSSWRTIHTMYYSFIPFLSLTRTDLPYVLDEDNEWHDEANSVAPEIFFFSDTIGYDVYQLYAYFQDSTETLYHPDPKLPIPVQNLIQGCRLCVKCVCDSNLIFQGCKNYYEHIVRRDQCAQPTDTVKFVDSFPTCNSVHRYCESYKLIGVVCNGWARFVISLSNYNPNESGCFRCPLSLLLQLIEDFCGVAALIPLCIKQNEDGERVYSTPWNTFIYHTYKDSVGTGHIALVVFYTDGEPFAKSGTQGARFLRIKFNNIKPYTQTFFMVVIALTANSIPQNLSDDRRRQLKAFSPIHNCTFKTVERGFLQNFPRQLH